MFRIPLLIGALTAAALLLAAPSTSMGVKKLQGSVGPGFTISLKKSGAKVRTLPAGKYSITVIDKSKLHDFHLKGPGLSVVITKTPFVGVKTITVTLKKGKTYKYVCDPHAASMHGSFRVT